MNPKFNSNWLSSWRFVINSKKCVPIFFALISALFVTLGFFSCKKDLINEGGSTQLEQGFKSFNWSFAEEEFFSLNSSLDQVSQRNVQKFRYNPILVEAFNQIAEENESNHFVDSLVQSGGLAQWSRSIVFPNSNTQEKVVLIPLIQRNKSDVNGLIVLYKKPGEFNNKFIINGISRSDLLDTLSGNDHQKAFLSDWMQRLDKSIFDHQDSKLADAHCAYKRRSRGSGSGPNPPNPVEPCYWRLVEICSDLNAQKNYISGVSILPPHLDHDGDGILNQDDEDWIKFSLEKNITQEQFTRIVKQWWDERVESDDELEGKEYDEYWDEIDWANGESWEDFIDKLDDIWDDFTQWLDGIDIHIDFDWLDRLFDPIQCPFDDPFNSGVQNREIRCQLVYVKICPTGSNWWDDIVETIPLGCDACWKCKNMRMSQFMAKLDHYISLGYLTAYKKITATEDPDYGNLLCKLIQLDEEVNLSKSQFQWLELNEDDILDEVSAFHIQKNDAESKTVIKFILDLDQKNALPIKRDDPNFIQVFNSYPEFQDDADNPWPGPNTDALSVLWSIAHSMEKARLKYENPSWSDIRLDLTAGWNVVKTGAHLALDGAGLVPGVGEIFDLTNALLYTFEGDYSNATLSTLSAIPFVGWVGPAAKVGTVATKTAGSGKLVFRLGSNGLVEFGSRGGLAKVLGTKGTGKQAHHILDWQHRSHDVIQAAAKRSGTDPFHMNELANGLALSTAQHLGSHPAYSAAVLDRLNRISDKFPNISPDQATQQLRNLADKIKTIINNNPTLKINDPTVVSQIYNIAI